MMKPRFQASALAAALLLPLATTSNAETVDKVMNAESKRTAAAQKSQQRVDGISDQTQTKLQDYKKQLKVIEGLKAYNAKLSKDVERQQQALNKIESNISEVKVIQRQVSPLLMRMIDGLETFVELDVPFSLQERRERIGFLRKNLDDVNQTTAEKFRQVLEAYKIENEYARKMEQYPDTIEIDGVDRQVTMLRIGRIALLYQTTDGQLSGAWDSQQGKFIALDNTQYRDEIRKGIRIAKKQASIDLLTIPVAAAEAM